jgi:hypothetical protein
MAKPPPKKRQPTLRELLERDAKNPLREIGVFDEVNKTPVENSITDIQEDVGMNEFMRRMKTGYADYQQRQPDYIVPNPGEFNPNSRIPKPINTNPAKLAFDILTMSSPAGERADTERARIAEYNARTNYGRNTPQEVYGMTALGGGPAYPRQGMMSKAMGVTNKKAGK